MQKFENFSFPSWPNFGIEEERAVQEVVFSGQLFAADKVRSFENAFQEYLGCDYALGLGNATQGLHLSLASLNIGLGDEVIVTPYSWISSASCIIMQNAVPIFCDIEEETFGLDPDKVEALISEKTKAIICVHMFGYPSQIEKISLIAKKYGIALIEDASHGHGSEYNEQKIGTFSDISVFSLHQRKALSVGDGGLVCTNRGELAEEIHKLRSFGSKSLSYNYRMTEFAGAIGNIKLKKLDHENEQRIRNFQLLSEMVSESLTTFLEPVHPIKNAKAVFYACLLKLTSQGLLSLNEDYLAQLQTMGVPIRKTWAPLHQHPHFNPTGNFSYARGIPWEMHEYTGSMKGQKYSELHLPVTENFCPNRILEVYIHPPCADLEMEVLHYHLMRLFE